MLLLKDLRFSLTWTQRQVFELDSLLFNIYFHLARLSTNMNFRKKLSMIQVIMSESLLAIAKSWLIICYIE